MSRWLRWAVWGLAVVAAGLAVWASVVVPGRTRNATEPASVEVAGKVVTEADAAAVADRFIAALHAVAQGQPAAQGTLPGVWAAAKSALQVYAGQEALTPQVSYQGWRAAHGQAYITVGGDVRFGQDSASAEAWRAQLVSAQGGWDLGEVRALGVSNDADEPAVAPWLAPAAVIGAALAIVALAASRLVVAARHRSAPAIVVGATATVLALIGLWMLGAPADDGTVQAVEGLTPASAYAWPQPQPASGWAFENGQGDMYGGGVVDQALESFWRAVVVLSLALVVALFPMPRLHARVGKSPERGSGEQQRLASVI